MKKPFFWIPVLLGVYVLSGCGAPRPPEPFGPRIAVNAGSRRAVEEPEQKKSSPQELLAAPARAGRDDLEEDLEEAL